MAKHKKYDFNIIHAENDNNFAVTLKDFLCQSFNINGFCTYDRLPGQYLLEQAVAEIKNSDVNICIIRGDCDPTLSHIFKTAIAIAAKKKTINKLVFIVHRGANKDAIIDEYNMYEDSFIEPIHFMLENDPGAMMELKDKMYKALGFSKTFQPTDNTTSEESASTAQKMNKAQIPTGMTARYEEVQPPSHIEIFRNKRYESEALDVFVELLIDIGNQLISEEIRDFKFLLQSHIEYGILETLNSPSEIFNHIQGKQMINSDDPSLLIEILFLIDRDDLAIQLGSRWQGARCCHIKLSNYRKMLYQFATALDVNDFKRMKQGLDATNSIKRRDTDYCKTAMDLLTLLEKETLVTESNMQQTDKTLRFLAKYSTNQQEVINIIESWYKAEISRPQSVKIFEEDGTKSESRITSPTSVSVPDSKTSTILQPMSLQSSITNSKTQPSSTTATSQPFSGTNSLDDSIYHASKEKLQQVLNYQKFPLLNNDKSVKVFSSVEMKQYYDQRQIIGQGGFGTVFKGVKPYMKTDVAVKAPNNPADTRSFIREKMMAYVKHPFLLPILAISDSNEIMFPYMPNGDLNMVLNGKNIATTNLLNSRIVQKMMYQISRALKFLHTPIKGIRHAMIHGDVKPSNILLDIDFNVRLCDRGLTEELDYSKSHLTASNQVAGTLTYQDPCMWNEAGKVEVRTANDIYSLGIVMAQLILKYSGGQLMPLPAKIGSNGWKKYLNKNYNKDVWGMRPTHLIDLVEHCVCDISERKLIDEVCKTLKTPVDIVEYKETSKCVLCLINEVDRKDTSLVAGCGCNVFCQSCLKMAFRNPLDCPVHGDTEPPIGHCEFYALLVGASNKEEKVFTNDVNNVYRTITDINIMGLRTKNVYRLVEEKENNPNCWKPDKKNLLEVFEKLQKEFTNKKNVTLLLYLSCHSNGEKFELNKHREYITKDELQESLMKLGFKNLMLVLDCCYAAKKAVPLLLFSEGREERSERAIYQLSSSSCAQRSKYVGDESLFTLYFVSGLKSGHGCPKSLRNGVNECKFCKDFRHTKLENQGYINLMNLHEYIRDHMQKDELCKGQTPRISLDQGESLNLAYYNHHELVYKVFHIKDNGAKQEINLKRSPMHFHSIENLNCNLWEQLENTNPQLRPEYIEIFRKSHSGGKEFDRVFGQITEIARYSQGDIFCRIRNNIDNLVSGPVAIPIPSNPKYIMNRVFTILGGIQDENNELGQESCGYLLNSNFTTEDVNHVQKQCTSLPPEALEILKQLKESVTLHSFSIYVKVYPHLVTFCYKY